MPCLPFPQPTLRVAARAPHPHPRPQQYRPAPIRIGSPPLTPIQESPKPKGGEKLMLVTPSIAAYLRQGGSVSIKGPDGKSWKMRAPIVSPACGVRMMRMECRSIGSSLLGPVVRRQDVDTIAVFVYQCKRM